MKRAAKAIFAAVLAAFSSALPAHSQANFPQVMPADSVYGQQYVSGPGEAISFSVLAQRLFGAQVLAVGSPITGSCTNGFNIFNNAGVVGCQANGGAGSGLTLGTTTVAGGVTQQLLYDNAGILGEVAKANSSVLISSVAGVPSWATSLPSGLMAPGLTVTGSFTATGLVTNADLVNPSTSVNGQTCTLGSTCTISASAGTITPGTTNVAGGVTNQLLYDNGGLLGEITKGNNCIYGTNGTGVPSCLTTLPASLSVPTLTVTGSFTATGLVTNADLVNAATTVNGTTCTLGSTCSITAASPSITVGTTTVVSGTTNQILYDNGGTLGEVTKGNSCVYGTNGTGVPSCVTTLPFVVSLATGGTNANLSASNGGIVYSGASALAILAGTATANLPLLSGVSGAPSWATVSHPTSATSGGIPYFSSTSVMGTSALLGANCVVFGGGAGVAPATSSSTCPTVSSAGVVTVPNTTSSSNTVTGALIVAGGLGVGGAVQGGSLGSASAIVSAGQIFAASSSGVTAGGGAVAVSFGNASSFAFGIYYGSGAPTISAPQGSLYLRTDGAANTRVYINSNGSTTWVGMTSS